MANCNTAQQISPTECMGDSLQKINTNFVNLDRSICGIPYPQSSDHDSTKHNLALSEQQTWSFDSQTKNSFAYSTRFDSIGNGVQRTTLALDDATQIDVTVFPYHSNSTVLASKPLATFSTISLTDNIPTVTLYWTAIGSNECAFVEDFNKPNSFTDKGPIWFNDTVSAIVSGTNKLYVGGSFTRVGGVAKEKFVAIDLTTSEGAISTSTTIEDLGSHGDVRKIVKASVIQNATPKEIIVIGGSFENIGLRGRSLLVYNATNDLYYPFYVNGEVNALRVIENRLYVGGEFDYVNYGTSSASVFSGQRLQTNGFFVVNLSQLLIGLMRGSLYDLSSVFNCTCNEPVVINDFEYYDGVLYIGGKFKIKTQTNLLSYQNLCSLNVGGLYGDGALKLDWKPIINGPIYCLHIDNTIAKGNSSYLYIGGDFSRVYTESQFNQQPRFRNKEIVNCENAICYKLSNLATTLTTPTLVSDFKPAFESPVTRFASHDDEPDSHIYCYGRHTSVNSEASNYLVAIKKAFSFNRGSVVPNIWNPSIEKAPSLINGALLKAGNALFVGGNFNRIGDYTRYNMAKVSDTAATSFAEPLSTFSFDVGAQIATPGLFFSLLSSTPATRKTSTPLRLGRVHATSFKMSEETFKGYTKGQLLRFFVRRPGLADALNGLPTNNDTFKQNVSIIGWKVDFN